MKNGVYKPDDCQVSVSEPPECNLIPSLSLFTGHHRGIGRIYEVDRL